MALWQPRQCEHQQRNTFWLNVDNSKAEALFATVRIHGLPVQIREIKFERDEVSRVEGEFNVIPGAKFSVTFKDMFLQHITSTFTRIRINGKDAGCIKMDKDRRPLSAEPSQEREWTVSAWADGTELRFDKEEPRGQIVVEYHSVKTAIGPEPEDQKPDPEEGGYRRMAIWRDDSHPEIQFQYSPKRPYATFVFNFHPAEEIPRKYKDEDEEMEDAASNAESDKVGANSDDEEEKTAARRKDKSKSKEKGKGKGKQRATPSSSPEGPDSGSDDDYDDTPLRLRQSVKGKGKGKAKEVDDDQTTGVSERKKTLRRGGKKSDSASEEQSSSPSKKKTRGKPKRGKGKKLSKETIESEDEEDSDAAKQSED